MKTQAVPPETLIRFPMDGRFCVLTMGHIAYDAPWKHFPRCSDDYIFYLVESGDLYIEEAGVRYHLGPNTALLLEPGKPHVGYQAACIHYYYIHFTCTKPLTAHAFTPQLRQKIVQLRADLLDSEWQYQWIPAPYDYEDLYFPKMAALGGSFDYFHAMEEANRLFFEGLEGRRRLVSLRLQEVLTRMCREFADQCSNPNAAKVSILVRDICQFLHEHYSLNITSQTISERFYVNYDYANRLFKRYIGQSIHDYLNTIRIHRAKQLLLSGARISAVAEAVGIGDPAYFSRLFKKIAGEPPKEYAKRRQEGQEK